jgi:hypothetical protein
MTIAKKEMGKFSNRVVVCIVLILAIQ